MLSPTLLFHTCSGPEYMNSHCCGNCRMAREIALVAATAEVSEPAARAAATEAAAWVAAGSAEIGP